MLLERLDKCLQILSNHENLIQLYKIVPTIGNSPDLIKVARFMSQSEESFDCSECTSHENGPHTKTRIRPRLERESGHEGSCRLKNSSQKKRPSNLPRVRNVTSIMEFRGQRGSSISSRVFIKP